MLWAAMSFFEAFVNIQVYANAYFVSMFWTAVNIVPREELLLSISLSNAFGTGPISSTNTRQLKLVVWTQTCPYSSTGLIILHRILALSFPLPVCTFIFQDGIIWARWQGRFDSISFKRLVRSDNMIRVAWAQKHLATTEQPAGFDRQTFRSIHGE